MSLQNKIDEIIELVTKYMSPMYRPYYEQTLNKLEELKGYKPNVKELEWCTEETIGGYIFSPFEIIGDIGFDYAIRLKDNQVRISKYSVPEYILGTYKTLDEAKQAAQLHFNNLIISCLE